LAGAGSKTWGWLALTCDVLALGYWNALRLQGLGLVRLGTAGRDVTGLAG